MMFELRITLLDVGIPVWRDIQLDDDTTFSDLHFILQSAFNWSDLHPHTFKFASPHKDTLAETDRLRDHIQGKDDKIIYTYNMEENWEHEIVLQKAFEAKADVLYPRCVRAENLAPEEDHTRLDITDGTLDLAYTDSGEIAKAINEELAYLNVSGLGEGLPGLDEDEWIALDDDEDEWEDDGGHL
ncbi:MAG: plasmid pRiA4b ORF-3 family protein [Trichococcus sp.]|uniref:plasmid pRiA4b ORF-3 family protein n=1 Tax=Trichococcus sp. TaxID=1985464 RepID=UPI003C6756B4